MFLLLFLFLSGGAVAVVHYVDAGCFAMTGYGVLASLVGVFAALPRRRPHEQRIAAIEDELRRMGAASNAEGAQAIADVVGGFGDGFMESASSFTDLAIGGAIKLVGNWMSNSAVPEPVRKLAAERAARQRELSSIDTAVMMSGLGILLVAAASVGLAHIGVLPVAPRQAAERARFEEAQRADEQRRTTARDQQVARQQAAGAELRTAVSTFRELPARATTDALIDGYAALLRAVQTAKDADMELTWDRDVAPPLMDAMGVSLDPKPSRGRLPSRTRERLATQLRKLRTAMATAHQRGDAVFQAVRRDEASTTF
jgi:hypothetical protein